MTKLEFLKQVEGNEYYPYVPQSGKSGVTIGIGVDLGNIGYKSLDIDPILKEKIKWYDKLTGIEAAIALDETPLRLTRDEVNLLSLAAIELHEKELEEQFNAESSVLYKDLPLEFQIVLLSVKYQYGSLARRTPKFWGFATRGKWHYAYCELMNFGDKYPTRREKEARLLLKGLEHA